MINCHTEQIDPKIAIGSIEEKPSQLHKDTEENRKNYNPNTKKHDHMTKSWKGHYLANIHLSETKSSTSPMLIKVLKGPYALLK